MAKTILILDGSPRPQGNTAFMAAALAEGVEAAGNRAVTIALRDKNILPCVGCYSCAAKKGTPCVRKDDMQAVYDAFEASQAVVFASPLYWWSFTAQMKTCIDRLFAVAASRDMKIPHRDCALLIAAEDKRDENFRIVTDYYQTCLVRNLNWTDRGMVLAGGVNHVGDIQHTEYPQWARQLGQSL